MNYNMAICNLELMKVLCKRIENVEETVGVAISALQELQMYKDGGLCLIPSKVYEKQCAELDDYKAIGTFGEVRAAVEKQKEKIPAEQSCTEKTHYKCPDCGFIMLTEYSDGYRLGNQPAFCERCGKHIDWSVSEC